MQTHHGFVPSSLEHSPRPTEREIRIKTPVFSHNERPRQEGGAGIG